MLLFNKNKGVLTMKKNVLFFVLSILAVALVGEELQNKSQRKGKNMKKKIIALCLSGIMLCGAFANTVFASDVCLMSPKKVATDNNNWDWTAWHSPVESYFLNKDPNTNVVKYSSFSVNRLRLALMCSDYMFLDTHGSQNALACYDENGNNTGQLTTSNILNFSSTYFSKMDLCLLMSCYSAKGNSNIAQALYSRGAKCVVGFEEDVSMLYGTTWLKHFADAFAVGWTVKKSVAYADMCIENNSTNKGNTDSHKIYGDANVYFE